MSLVTQDALLKMLRDELGIDTSDVDAQTKLFSSGIVDSFSLVSIIRFLEEEGGIRVAPTDVTLDNFDTIASMLAYTERAGRRGGE